MTCLRMNIESRRLSLLLVFHDIIYARSFISETDHLVHQGFEYACNAQWRSISSIANHHHVKEKYSVSSARAKILEQIR